MSTTSVINLLGGLAAPSSGTHLPIKVLSSGVQFLAMGEEIESLYLIGFTTTVHVPKVVVVVNPIM